jgi:7,8-dihydro-6-hydroxymethylpterin-pyrophosphokinase
VPASAGLDPGGAARLLEIPHPSMRDRLFVIAPLLELAPDLVPPGWTRSLEATRGELVEGEPEAVAPTAVWDSAAARWP